MNINNEYSETKLVQITNIEHNAKNCGVCDKVRSNYYYCENNKQSFFTVVTINKTIKHRETQ